MTLNIVYCCIQLKKVTEFKNGRSDLLSRLYGKSKYADFRPVPQMLALLKKWSVDSYSYGYLSLKHIKNKLYLHVGQWKCKKINQFVHTHCPAHNSVVSLHAFPVNKPLILLSGPVQIPVCISMLMRSARFETSSKYYSGIECSLYNH